MWDIIANSPLRLIAALVIGLLTAWLIWGRLASSASATAETTASKAEETAGAVAGAATGAMGAAKSAATKAADAAKDAANEATDTAKAAATTVSSSASMAVADTKEAVSDMLDKPNIAAAVGEPDDLTRIKGIGPKLNDLCHSLGVRRFDQIANWSDADVAEVDQYLKIKGRITRDKWVDQAKLLAAGDDAGHKAQFG